MRALPLQGLGLGLALGFLAVFGGLAQPALADLPVQAAVQCDERSVEILSPEGQVVRFSVELATTPAMRAQGLMNRAELARSSGMLFIYEEPQRAVFWMKNTLIPLDMIFADASGRIRHVHANAIPHDETGIDGGEGVLAVLEINGGLAARLGIVEGAVLRHPLLDPAVAVAPCLAVG